MSQYGVQLLSELITKEKLDTANHYHTLYPTNRPRRGTFHYQDHHVLLSHTLEEVKEIY